MGFVAEINYLVSCILYLVSYSYSYIDINYDNPPYTKMNVSK